MAKAKGKAGQRAKAAGRDRPRTRKSGSSKASKSGSRKPKPAKSAARKQKAFPASESARLKQQLKAARLQRHASAEILRAVADASGDAARPLQQITEATARLFGASSVSIQLAEGSEFTQEYRVGAIAKRVGSAYPRSNIKVGGRNLPGTVVAETRQIHIPDLDRLDPSMSDFPGLPHARAGGARTVCGTPLRREGKAIGALIVWRDRLLPFTNDELALQQTFADQAVIAVENARLFNETREALEQQTATAEVLGVINSSPGDLAPVFDAMLERAMRLCDAASGHFRTYDGNSFSLAAVRGEAKHIKAMQQSGPLVPGPHHPVSRFLRGDNLIHLSNTREAEEYRADARFHLLVDLGVLSLLSVALRKDGLLLGYINVYRDVAEPFTDRQIALLQNFASQAVIAMENVRLLRELRGRTDDLTESLQQQTATSNLLQVISRSAFDIQPIFDAIAERSVTLCGADRAFIYRFDGELLRMTAAYNASPDFKEWVAQHPIRPGRDTGSGRAALERCTIHIHDVRADPEYTFGAKDVESIRTILGVPILKGDELLGVMMIFHLEVRPFTEKQIALVETFADQAAIAIENVRLFNEVQARTRDVEEALTYQSGSANILNVIASSPTDVQPVLKAIVESACELCGAYDAAVVLRDGEDLRFSAHHGPIPIGLETWPINRRWTAGRAFLDRKPVHIEDLRDEKHADFSDGRELSLRMGHRSILSVPLLREGESVGAIVLRRIEVNPFTEKQIALLQTFADQAVIAIGNVRLFDEVQAKTRDLEVALQQQTATADVLKVISRSAFDLQSVLQTLVESARQLLSTDTANIYLRDGELMRVRAQTGMSDEFHKFLQERPATAERGRFIGRAFLTAEIVHLPDVLADPEYSFPTGPQVGGYRAVLGVPMVRDGRVEGVFGLSKSMPGPFTAREIEIVRTFADQALIAIENARLFGEVQDRTRELSQSLDDLRAAQDRLVQTEKLASLGQLTAGIAHEIKNPLNFVNNFAALSVELTDELNDVLEQAELVDKMRGEVGELTQLLKSNLEKVVQHGNRADSIVKNMLLHSREGSGEHRPTDINSLLDESLNLAYHGARAEKGEFNITLQRDFDADAGTIELFPQEITRAFLNLIANGVYAATKRKTDEKEPGFEPTLRATTKNLGTTVEIRIRDNGTGIPAEVQEKMFNPFFTTKPAGEGTGLGLSMTHDIIVKQHGGRIDVATEPGQFTEFTIVLPRQSNLVRRGET